MGKPYREMTASERLADRAQKNRVIEEKIAARRRGDLSDVKILFAGKDLVGFSFADTFPVIASLIDSLSAGRNDFVGHEDIVMALVEDDEMGPLLSRITSKDPEKKTKQWWADSMMKWFSQTFTTGANPYADRFDRHPTDRPYRYRTRQPS